MVVNYFVCNPSRRIYVKKKLNFKTNVTLNLYFHRTAIVSLKSAVSSRLSDFDLSISLNELDLEKLTAIKFSVYFQMECKNTRIEMKFHRKVYFDYVPFG